MDVLVMTGSHPRHDALVETVASSGWLSGVVTEQRESHIPEPPDHLDEHLTGLFKTHFQRRRDAEVEFFGSGRGEPEVPSLTVTPDKLNSEAVVDFASRIDPDLTITYGIGILEERLLSAIPGEMWNVHAGLTPEYRGVITHFWPSYRLEPQMTGVTLHELTAAVDQGPVVHQTAAPLVRGDGLHQLACRTMQSFFSELPSVLELSRTGDLAPPSEQERSGKLWTSSDWRPEHLILIYDVYDNAIVDRFLDGEFSGEEPTLVRQFKD